MRISNKPSATLQRWVTTIALSILVPCGLSCSKDSPTDPIYVDNPPSPGGGTGTLHVVVEVQGCSENGVVTETEFTATVTDTLGAPVSGSVVVSGRFGNVQLVEGPAGAYSALRSGYVTGSYTLTVSSGPDNVTGVSVLAPDVHAITTPTANEIVQANTALNVRWTRVVPTSECRLETRDYDSDWIFGDNGTLYVPTVGNPPRTDQRIRVERRNSQIPLAALPGSRLSVSVLYTVEPVIAQ